MKCKLCGESRRKTALLDPDKNFCWTCDTFYHMLYATLHASKLFYREKAPNRIPEDISEVIKRLEKYIKLTIHPDGLLYQPIPETNE